MSIFYLLPFVGIDDLPVFFHYPETEQTPEVSPFPPSPPAQLFEDVLSFSNPHRSADEEKPKTNKLHEDLMFMQDADKDTESAFSLAG